MEATTHYDFPAVESPNDDSVRERLRRLLGGRSVKVNYDDPIDPRLSQ